MHYQLYPGFGCLYIESRDDILMVETINAGISHVIEEKDNCCVFFYDVVAALVHLGGSLPRQDPYR